MGLSAIYDNDRLRDYARKICGDTFDLDLTREPALYKKIFLTLVLVEKTSAVLQFLSVNVTDDDLPLVKVHRPGKPRVIFDLARRNQPNVPLQCFRHWTSSAIRGFEEWQWTTLAPFFAKSEKTVPHYVFQDRRIMPFIARSRRKVNTDDRFEFEGGFSEVSRVEIHPSHHDFFDSHVRRERPTISNLQLSLIFTGLQWGLCYKTDSVTGQETFRA